MRNQSNGCGPIFLAVILSFVGGVLLIAWLMKADPLKPQPSQAVVSAAYATTARIENDALRARLAEDHAAVIKANAITLAGLQTLKDMAIIVLGAGALFGLAHLGASATTAASAARRGIRLIKPDGSGKFPLIVDARAGTAYNANLQSTAQFTFEAPEELPIDARLEAFTWDKRANMVASLAKTRTFAGNISRERAGMLHGAMPLIPGQGQGQASPQPLPQPITIGGEANVIMHGSDDDMTPPPSVRVPAHKLPHDLTEDEFNDYIRNSQ